MDIDPITPNPQPLRRAHVAPLVAAVLALGVFLAIWMFDPSSTPLAAGHHITPSCEGLEVTDTPLTGPGGTPLIAPVGFTTWEELGTTTVTGYQNGGTEGPKTASRPQDCVQVTTTVPETTTTTVPESTTSTTVQATTTTVPVTSTTQPTTSSSSPATSTTVAPPGTEPSTTTAPAGVVSPPSPATVAPSVGLPETK